MIVPNLFPKLDAPYRIAVIGESPGKDEVATGQPFVGMSGRFLMALLSRAGLSRDALYIGNVCQHQPPNNDIASFRWDGHEIQSGLAQLTQDLRAFKPNICLLLGRIALKAAKDLSTHPLTGKCFTHSIDDWRGSLFLPQDSASPMFGMKCLGSYHPAAVLRQYSWAPLLQFDIKKTARHGSNPTLELPQRHIEFGLTSNQIIERLRADLNSVINGLELIRGTDIEGYWNGMTCFGIADTSRNAYIIPFQCKDGSHYFSEDEEREIWFWLSKWMACPYIKKVWQNGLYDRWCFQYGHQIPVFGNAEDIMLKHWELYCELEKSLACQVSLYTNQPFYKGDRKTNDDRTYWIYNGTDSCVTKEISDFLTPKLDARAREHYAFNHALLNPLLYMELRGIRYATERAKERRAALVAAGYAEQVKLDRIAGTGCESFLQKPKEWLSQLTGLNCAKKYVYSSFDDLHGAWLKKKKQGVEDWFDTHSARIIELSKKMPNLTDSEIGELSTLSYTHMNVDSNKQFQEYIYGKLALPTQWKKDPKTKEERPTTDYEALLKLAKVTNHPVCRIAIDLRSIGTRASMLGIYADADGRIRCGYNVVGTETGRLSCYTSPTGSGYNLTTIPDYQTADEAPGKICGDRDLFLADEGHWFFQCDLKGADGWTIGAHSKALGDPTMWDDLMGGVKPAMVLALGVRGLTKYLSPTTPRDEIKAACAQVKKTDWDYFACKIGIWGACYLMGPDLLRAELLQESDGKLVWSRTDAVNFQKLIFYRYRGVKEWHKHMASRLSVEPAITAASGHRRVFFGRKDELLGQALAHEPQANTTYATNKAMHGLWHDPDNRLRADTLDGTFIFKRRFPTRDVPRNGCILRVEPLHQVHDALDGQFIKEDVEFAKRKVPQWFDNPVIIAGQKLVIPYDGGYGPSWGETKEGTI